MPWTLVVSRVSVLSIHLTGQIQEWILDLLCTIMLSVYAQLPLLKHLSHETGYVFGYPLVDVEHGIKLNPPID